MPMQTQSAFTALKLCCGAAALATVLGLGGCSMFGGDDHDHDRHTSTSRSDRYDDRARTGSYDASRSDRYDNNSSTYDRSGTYDRSRSGSYDRNRD